MAGGVFGGHVTTLQSACGDNTTNCWTRSGSTGFHVQMRATGNELQKLTLLIFQAQDGDGKLVTIQKTVELRNPGSPKPSPPSGKVARDKANVWVKGEAFRVSRTEAKKPHDQFYASADIKLEYSEVVFNKHYVGPSFDLKASTVPDADPDTLCMGIRYQMPNIFLNVHWDNLPKFESTKDFQVSDFLHSSMLTYPVPRLPGKGEVPVDIDLQGGFELGRNIDNVLTEAKGTSIARAVVGGMFFYKMRNVLGAKKVVFKGDYIRRWPFTREVVVQNDPDDKSKLLVVAFGRGPKQHAEANLEFTYNDYFGFFVGYEYGQLPPGYKLADHRAKIGFLWKFGPK
jgi:hypothetical protein